MEFKDITTHNILSYIKGYSSLFLSLLNLQPLHIQEQVAYRASKCSLQCITDGKCKHCGCDRDAKLFLKESCNKDIKLPDLMEKDKWIEYKELHNI